MRKIIQLLTAPSYRDSSDAVLTALCDDGSIWQRVWDGDLIAYRWADVEGVPAGPDCARARGALGLGAGGGRAGAGA